MLYNIFISYSRKDSDVVNRIRELFDKAGITYFVDRNMHGAVEFPTMLAEAIDESDLFLFIASENSYNSKFVQSEVAYALKNKKIGCILPYIIDDSSLPKSLDLIFSSINWRTTRDCPIGSVFVDDVLSILKTVKGRRKSNKKRLFIIFSIVFISLILFYALKPLELVPLQKKSMEYVDLGLSVYWASCNLGASSPEEAGEYYAWGEVKTKNIFDEKNYKWFNDADSSYAYIKMDITGSDLDVAYDKLGDKWRLPSYAEFDELYKKCEIVLSQQNEVTGYKIVGPNGNSIFLPLGGLRMGNSLCNPRKEAYFWLGESSDIGDKRTALAFYLSEVKKEDGTKIVKFGMGGLKRYFGLSVRPVREK